MCRTGAKISSLFEHETLKKKKKRRKNGREPIIQTSDFSTGPLIRGARLLAPREIHARASVSRATAARPPDRHFLPRHVASCGRARRICTSHERRTSSTVPPPPPPPFNPRESEGLGAISETSRSPRDVSSGYTTSSCLISLISIPPPFPSRFVLLLSLRFALNFSAKGRPFPTSFASLRSTIPLFSISSPSSTSCCSCFFFSSSRDFFRSNISKRVGIEAVGKQGGFWWEKRRKGLRDSLKRGPGGSFFAPAETSSRVNEIAPRDSFAVPWNLSQQPTVLAYLYR